MDKKDLQTLVSDISAHAKGMHGLEFCEVQFELVEPNMMTELISKNAFPIRYPHWSFGREYVMTDLQVGYGMMSFYELVTNHNPAVAYLVKGNHEDMQIMVIAHVLAHVDFFQKNRYFANTIQDCYAMFEQNRETVISIGNSVGTDVVETFIDQALVLEAQIDLLQPYNPPKKNDIERIVEERLKLMISTDPQIERLFVQDEEHKLRKRITQEVESELLKKPYQPTHDVLGFLIKHSPDLLDWQRDILRVVREESLYFEPQKLTKTMNEGWATFWHDRIVREMRLIKDKVFYASAMSGILGNSKMGLNPYKLGFELFSHIKEYGDLGRFDPAYFKEIQVSKRKAWNTNANQGDALIKQVREMECDYTFLLKYATDDFIHDKRLYAYQKKSKAWWADDEPDEYVIKSRDPNEIRAKMMQTIFKAYKVSLNVLRGDHSNQGELYIKINKEDEGLEIIPPRGLGISENAFFEGRPVKKPELEDTLKALYAIWQRPVHIEAPLTAPAGSITEMSLSARTPTLISKIGIVSYDGNKITYDK